MRISDWSSDVCSSDLFQRTQGCSPLGRWRGEDGGFPRPGAQRAWLPPFPRTKRAPEARQAAICSPPEPDGVSSGASKSLSGRRWPPCNPSPRSEEHTSELQSLMRISYAVFCLKKKTKIKQHKIK